MNNYPFPGAKLDQESVAVSISDGKTDAYSEQLRNSAASSSIQFTHKYTNTPQKRVYPSKKPPTINKGKANFDKRHHQKQIH